MYFLQAQVFMPIEILFSVHLRIEDDVSPCYTEEL